MSKKVSERKSARQNESDRMKENGTAKKTEIMRDKVQQKKRKIEKEIEER